MAEAAPTPFIMHGAREAMASGLAHIAQQVEGIERAVVENPGLDFDLAKTLVESACRSILGERSVSYGEPEDLPQLFRAATRVLSFPPPSASGAAEARESLKRTLNGLSTAIQGICELRNQWGFASHGSGNPRPPMEAVQALLAAEAADAIVGFLHRVHRQDRTPTARALAYGEHPEFNDHVDDAHGMMRIFESEFRPSEVLFTLEPESYRVYLAEFETGEENDGEGTPDQVAEAAR
jgi:hypothetical protein